MAKLKSRVMHITTVHARDDLRIFRKECAALARSGYEVILVVGDGKGEALVDGVRIVDIGIRPSSRLARMRQQPRAVLASVLQEQPSLVHIHDPELLPMGVRLAQRGVQVVYDAHEDVPRQILTKQWIPAALRRLVSIVFERYENHQVAKLAAVCAATPYIAARFAPVVRHSINVSNYPFPEELAPIVQPVPRERAVCYVGGIMRTRGLLQMVRALPYVPDVKLYLCGRFEDPAIEADLRAEPGWSQVHYLGEVGRDEVRQVLARSSAGLATLLPMPSYMDSVPIKLYEYMSAELPLIASDFPLWREIVQSTGCGICVDPTDPVAIAAAITAYVDSPQRVRDEGRAGRRAVLKDYHWSLAESELLSLYSILLPGTSSS